MSIFRLNYAFSHLINLDCRVILLQPLIQLSLRLKSVHMKINYVIVIFLEGISLSLLKLVTTADSDKLH